MWDKNRLLVALVLLSVVAAVMAYVRINSRRAIVGPAGEPLELTIREPRDNAEVGVTEVSTGTISPPKGAVIVLVRPIKTGGFWIQEHPIVDGRGIWKTRCNFGEESVGAGEAYEIVAFAYDDLDIVRKNPELAAGKRLLALEELPVAAGRAVVRVTRRAGPN